jgi:16S rRNA (uracil1498-N3)-methyltransferase
MPRLYYPVSKIKDNMVLIVGDKARYLTSVLRCKKGDELLVFDGQGTCLKTKIVNADRKEVGIEVLEQFPCEADSPANIVLVQGLLKGEKMDLIIQKTTELGVKEIIPATTERCQIRVTRKLDRWRKIAQEASRQSGRSVVPIIHAPVDLRGILTSCSSQEKMCGFVFYEKGVMGLSEAIQKIRVHHAFSPLYIVIGPEGGFTSEEIALAQDKGLMLTSFGRRIMRSETAAIAAVTLVQFLLGDLS